MANMPKRRKLKDNPYSLNIDENNNYTINFKDNKNIIHSIEVSEKVFSAFNSFELEDIKLMHEYERHIEHFDLDENSIHQRTTLENNSVDVIVESKLLNEELKNAINELSDIQKQRVIKYYFENKTLEQIAQEGGCSKRAIKFSIDIALEKISQKLKK